MGRVHTLVVFWLVMTQPYGSIETSKRVYFKGQVPSQAVGASAPMPMVSTFQPTLPQ